MVDVFFFFFFFFLQICTVEGALFAQNNMDVCTFEGEIFAQMWLILDFKFLILDLWDVCTFHVKIEPMHI